MGATLCGKCGKARSAIDGIFSYLDTQLPFSYVHLMSVVVHINCTMVAVKCGAVAAVAIKNIRREETDRAPISDAENVQVLFLQVFAAVVIPLVTVGLLEVSVLVSDPFST